MRVNRLFVSAWVVSGLFLSAHPTGASDQPVLAGPTLVSDINANGAFLDGYGQEGINELAVIGDTVFFSQSDGPHGLELWKSDGTAAGTVLVKDIVPGLESSFPQNLTPVNDTLFFLAYHPLYGYELWASDGTEAGTSLAKDIWPGPYNGYWDGKFVALNGTLYFAADDGVTGRELWRSDGTANGTVLVEDLAPGIESSNPSELTDFNGLLVFVAASWEYGSDFESGLYKSDGTSAGTFLFLIGSISSLTTVNDKLFFAAYTDSVGVELFWTNGMPGGTGGVDIWPGAPGYLPDFTFVRRSSDPSNLVNVGGVLYFAADDGTHGRELFKSDGTAAGTVGVKDIALGAASSTPERLTNAGGTLFFTAGASGSELWKSNGTPSGTVLAKDFSAGGFNVPDRLTNVAGTLFFTADDGTHGVELWKSDGTSVGTTLVRDIRAGGLGSFEALFPYPWALLDVNGTLFFSCNNGPFGVELWTSDGTSAGTVLVKDVYPWTADSNVFVFANLPTTTLIKANNGLYDSELWKTDGTAAGTVLVKDINPGPAGSFNSPGESVVMGTVAFFTADDGTNLRALWKSDGTAAGTVLVSEVHPLRLTDVNGMLFFSSADDSHGFELWKSDGTAGGTVIVKDIFPGPQSSIIEAHDTEFVNIGGTLFFRATDGVNGEELWKSDGTAAGTVRVKDIAQGSAWSYPRRLTDIDGTLFFFAEDFVHGVELWTSDGTEAGTTLIDINPGSGWSGVSGFLNVGGVAFFVASDGIHGGELWKSDGTEGGTVMVRDIAPGTAWSSPAGLTDFEGTLFFQANDGTSGCGLWKSDGTEAGTVLVEDICPGLFTSFNDRLFFVATDGVTANDSRVEGYQLWTSDGTSAGTVLFADIHFSQIGNFAVANQTLYFSANDLVHGLELWKIEPEGDVNQPPTVGAITAPLDPTRLGLAINASAAFSDVDTLDLHTAVWNWGDSTTLIGTVTESNGAGTVTGSHVYSTAGLYTVTLTLTDDDSGAAQSIFQYVVIYNPDGGFVTGGGTIDSPAGALVGNPTASGIAQFAFLSKYQQGAQTPTGETRFRFNFGDFSFESASYDWMVISGAKARYRGTGTVNASGSFGFQITIIDGDRPGGGGVDRFRIKIWNTLSHAVVYDNQLGSADDDDPVTALRGGSIRIQR